MSTSINRTGNPRCHRNARSNRLDTFENPIYHAAAVARCRHIILTHLIIASSYFLTQFIACDDNTPSFMGIIIKKKTNTFYTITLCIYNRLLLLKSVQNKFIFYVLICILCDPIISNCVILFCLLHSSYYCTTDC